MTTESYLMAHNFTLKRITDPAEADAWQNFITLNIENNDMFLHPLNLDNAMETFRTWISREDFEVMGIFREGVTVGLLVLAVIPCFYNFDIADLLEIMWRPCKSLTKREKYSCVKVMFDLMNDIARIRGCKSIQVHVPHDNDINKHLIKNDWVINEMTLCKEVL